MVTVPGCKIKAVLRAIDDFGRGRTAWAGRERLAASAGVSVRLVSRAVNALELSLLVAVQRSQASGETSRKTLNRYTLHWPRLAMLCPVENAVENPANNLLISDWSRGDQSATVTDQCATVTYQSATVTDQVATGGILTGLKAQEEPPPTGAIRFEGPPPSPKSWEAAAECLLREGIGGKAAARIVAAWKRTKRGSPRDLVIAIGDALAAIRHPGNAAKFERPQGALVYRLEFDRWPVEDVIDPKAEAEREAARKAKERRVAMEGILQDVVKAGRRQGKSDEEIKSVLRERMSEEFLVSQGW